MRKKKCLIICIFNLNKTTKSSCLKEVRTEIDLLTSKYENMVILAKCNSELIEESMLEFFREHNIKHVTKEQSRFENSEKPRTIDLDLTSKPKSFQYKSSFGTGKFIFHTVTLSVVEAVCKKQSSGIISHRPYKIFDNRVF